MVKGKDGFADRTRKALGVIDKRTAHFLEGTTASTSAACGNRRGREAPRRRTSLGVSEGRRVGGFTVLSHEGRGNVSRKRESDGSNAIARNRSVFRSRAWGWKRPRGAGRRVVSRMAHRAPPRKERLYTYPVSPLQEEARNGISRNFGSKCRKGKALLHTPLPLCSDEGSPKADGAECTRKGKDCPRHWSPPCVAGASGPCLCGRDAWPNTLAPEAAHDHGLPVAHTPRGTPTPLVPHSEATRGRV